MSFTSLILELATPLHIGAGRGGMLARGHGFVPGHVVSYALAAAIGKASGGRYDDFARALDAVLRAARCGPLFIRDAGENRVLLPRRDREAIENRHLSARSQVNLDPGSGSAVESALFEVESIAARVRHGSQRGRPVQLVGGLWHQNRQLAGKPVADWFQEGLLLGGELKGGLGRVRLAEHGWLPDALRYANNPAWSVNEHGLRLTAGDILPGPSLDGTTGAPLQPWLGRLYDREQGFGRRFSPPVLVRMDGTVEEAGVFLPADSETGLGCWTRVATV